MKILVIQGSPNSDSFSHSNAIHYQKQALAQGHEVQLVDLSKDDFDPILRHGYRKHMEDETYPNLMQEKLLGQITWSSSFQFGGLVSRLF
ncbi:NAD(P)H-dependent oxidoreductase [Lactococcus raffinolactis]|uniref:NAD(P)H-dependent oxidoreductase n=1 Tax=Pseudolactococcus raffinolactis TaxID=1366 RepID=UPI0035BC15CD